MVCSPDILNALVERENKRVRAVSGGVNREYKLW